MATLTTCVLGSSDELRRGTRDVKRRHSSARSRRISWPASPNIHIRRGMDAGAIDWKKFTRDAAPVVIKLRTNAAEHVAVLLCAHKWSNISDDQELSNGSGMSFPTPRRDDVLCTGDSPAPCGLGTAWSPRWAQRAHTCTPAQQAPTAHGLGSSAHHESRTCFSGDLGTNGARMVLMKDRQRRGLTL